MWIWTQTTAVVTLTKQNFWLLSMKNFFHRLRRRKSTSRAYCPQLWWHSTEISIIFNEVFFCRRFLLATKTKMMQSKPFEMFQLEIIETNKNSFSQTNEFILGDFNSFFLYFSCVHFFFSFGKSRQCVEYKRTIWRGQRCTANGTQISTKYGWCALQFVSIFSCNFFSIWFSVFTRYSRRPNESNLNSEFSSFQTIVNWWERKQEWTNSITIFVSLKSHSTRKKRFSVKRKFSLNAIKCKRKAIFRCFFLLPSSIENFHFAIFILMAFTIENDFTFTPFKCILAKTRRIKNIIHLRHTKAPENPWKKKNSLFRFLVCVVRNKLNCTSIEIKLNGRIHANTRTRRRMCSNVKKSSFVFISPPLMRAHRKCRAKCSHFVN